MSQVGLQQQRRLRSRVVTLKRKRDYGDENEDEDEDGATTRKQHQKVKRTPRRVSLKTVLPSPSEGRPRPAPVSSTTDQELAQARKESAKAVLDSILADKNASSTVKLYRYPIRDWQVHARIDFCLLSPFLSLSV